MLSMKLKALCDSYNICIWMCVFASHTIYFVWHMHLNVRVCFSHHLLCMAHACECKCLLFRQVNRIICLKTWCSGAPFANFTKFQFLSEIRSLTTLFSSSLHVSPSTPDVSCSFSSSQNGLLATYALETLVLCIFNLFRPTFTTPLQVLAKFLGTWSPKGHFFVWRFFDGCCMYVCMHTP